ncbi:MAG: glycine cleavage system protein T [Gammaproteobacteria bacterium RIFCSPHIGHO2_12_FULL_41_20]|nr:MAG: glycine cleavage system protein T [Gammaproteobacteria bacterium RIFCSPHIGHO2_12_FULL_41_20]
MGKRTPLYEAHCQANAKIVDFAGWDMPLHYGSQIHEHHQVRQAVGVFDVSHMGIVDVYGKQAVTFLRFMFANNVDRLAIYKALYTCMLNEQGGIIDDLIVYKLAEDYYRLVINAGRRDQDTTWLKQHITAYDAVLTPRNNLALLAVQGPRAKDIVPTLFSTEEAAKIRALKSFTACPVSQHGLVARTGYTGEDGFEIMLPTTEISHFWEKLLAAGVAPCGLGARDTLRLEAGLNLYGTDMDESVTPLESNLAWTVAWEPADRQFIGRQALEKQRQQGTILCLVGLVLQTPGVLRGHQTVILDSQRAGIITSGGFSPTLNQGIALARIPTTTDTTCWVEIRGKQLPAAVIKPPFVRHGKKAFNLTECEKE